MRQRITGLILAGGRGSRMGGRDKGLVMIGGQTLVAHAVARLRPQVDQLLINANRNETHYAAFGYPVVRDLHADFPGPLAGIATGLAHTADGLLAIVPCDSPFLPRDLVSRLHAALVAEDADVAVAQVGGELQPVFALIKTQLHESLMRFMVGSDSRIAAWFRLQKLAVVEFDDEAAFANLNAEEDCAQAASRLNAERLSDVIGLAGYSGSGKTTLLRKLLPVLTRQGLRVGVIKHAHHQFDLDQPGKDSYEIRHAGAARVLVASSQRWALIHEREETGDPPLFQLVETMRSRDLDLILVEGFRHERFTKVEIHRPELGRPLLCLQDDSVIGVASSAPVPLPKGLPAFRLDDAEGIAAFILQQRSRRLTAVAERPGVLA